MRRLWEHKHNAGSAFTSRYRIDRLVWFERHGDVGAAIARETQIKGWTRARKMALIVAENPEWRDLSEEWGKPAEMRFRGEPANYRDSSGGKEPPSE